MRYNNSLFLPHLEEIPTPTCTSMYDNPEHKKQNSLFLTNAVS